jgi:ribonucleoside-diphosphate reductase alpha chain
MAKYLVETYYTCSFKVSHYLDDINEENLNNLEKNDDGKFEIIDVKLDNRKTKTFKILKVVKSKLFHNQLVIKILKVLVNPN